MASSPLNDNPDQRNEDAKLCRMCKESQNKEVWMHHLEIDFYKEEKEFTCVLCSLLFADHNELADHYLNMHIAKQPWKCQFCQKQFLCVKDWMRHLPTEKPKRGSKSMSACSYSKGPYCLIRSEKKADKYKFDKRKVMTSSCDVCGAMFPDNLGLIQHKQSHESEEKSMHAHEDQSLKSKPKRYACALCGREFPSKIALTRHQRSNNMKKKKCAYRCHICLKFIQFGQWQKHIHETHEPIFDVSSGTSLSPTHHPDGHSLEVDKTLSSIVASGYKREIHANSINFERNTFEVISELTETETVDSSGIPEIKLENDFESTELENYDFPAISEVKVEKNLDWV